jgi:hypothetical protein
MGPINAEGLSFLQELGRRITLATGDPREGSFLIQRVSMAIQRYNAIAFHSTFEAFDDNAAIQ